MKSFNRDIPIHLAGTAAILLLVCLGYMFGIKPILTTRKQIQEYRDKNQQLITQTSGYTKANAELSKEIRIVENALRDAYPLRFDEQLYRDEEPILKLVSLLLSKRELELINFREQSHTADAIEVEIQSKGAYAAVVGLMHDLRQLERPVRILKWTLNPLDEYGKKFGSSCTLRFVASEKRPVSLSDLAGRDERRSAANTPLSGQIVSN